MNKDTLRQLANALSVLLALTVNILASTLPLNGQNTGEISDRFQVYFVPAGYVFAIWGIIYIGWIAFAIYQFRSAQKESPRLRKLGYLFALSGIFNAAWLFCWHYNLFGLSVLVMLTLLGLLIASYLKLNVGRTACEQRSKNGAWIFPSASTSAGSPSPQLPTSPIIFTSSTGLDLESRRRFGRSSCWLLRVCLACHDDLTQGQRLRLRFGLVLRWDRAKAG